MTNLGRLVVLAILIVIAAVVWYAVSSLSAVPTSAPMHAVATALYQCDGGKTIQASFYAGSSTPATSADQPPLPGGKVVLTLPGGQTLTLNQTISADGSRYSDGNPNVSGSETFVFWSKGNGAIVMQGGQEKDYKGCISVAADPGGLSNVYESGTKGFSIRYPAGYSVDDKYLYQGLGPGKEIGGVKFTVSTSTTSGTNLGSDTYLSVEEIPGALACSAALFLDPQQHVSVSTTTKNSVEYSFASSTGAAAGNRYEEDVYAIPGSNPCTAIRYFIHFGVIENYPKGAVQQFDEGALKHTFDSMRGTLTLNP